MAEIKHSSRRNPPSHHFLPDIRRQGQTLHPEEEGEVTPDDRTRTSMLGRKTDGLNRRPEKQFGMKTANSTQQQIKNSPGRAFVKAEGVPFENRTQQLIG